MTWSGAFRCATITLALSGSWAFAAGEPVKMVVVDYPPLTIQVSGSSSSGVGVDIVRELAKRASVSLVEAQVPIPSMMEVAEKEISILANITRNESRESKLRWIGRIVTDRYCFVTLKGKP